MISKVKNIILNKLIGVKRRYKQALSVGESSRFLNSFSLIGNVSRKEQVTIGEKCLVGAKLIFETDQGQIEIGDRVYIGDSTIICRSKVVFGNDILVAWGVTFYDHDSHSIDYRHRQEDIKQVLIDFKNGKDFLKNKDWDVVNSSPIHIQNNAWIGMEALILKGVTIGEGAIVAARSVVTKDVPPFTVVAGNPAKVVKKIEKTSKENNPT